MDLVTHGPVNGHDARKLCPFSYLGSVVHSQGVSYARRGHHQKEREEYRHKEEHHVAEADCTQLVHA